MNPSSSKTNETWLAEWDSRVLLQKHSNLGLHSFGNQSRRLRIHRRNTMHLDSSVLLVHFSPFLTCTEFQTAFLLLSFAAWPLLLNLLLRPLFKSSAVSNLPPCPTLPLPIYLNISTYCLGVSIAFLLPSLYKKVSCCSPPYHLPLSSFSSGVFNSYFLR